MARTILLAVLALIATAAAAQQAVPPVSEERVVLDAAEKRIVEEQYRGVRAIDLQGRDAGGWSVYAGAAIDAQRIDLTLRNVRGELRYRADWSRLAPLLRRQRLAVAREVR